MDIKNSLQRAIALCRSQSDLARRVAGFAQRKCAPANIDYWLSSPSGVGAEYVIAVAASVAFEVTPHQLRPDLYPHPDDGLPANMREQARAAE